MKSKKTNNFTLRNRLHKDRRLFFENKQNKSLRLETKEMELFLNSRFYRKSCKHLVLFFDPSFIIIFIKKKRHNGTFLSTYVTPFTIVNVSILQNKKGFNLLLLLEQLT